MCRFVLGSMGPTRAARGSLRYGCAQFTIGFRHRGNRRHRSVPLHIDDLPPGAVLKCYESYMVQDLVIESKNTLYLRARYELPDGGSMLAPVPADVILGKHFGATSIG